MNCSQLSLSPTKLIQSTASCSVSLIFIVILSPYPRQGFAIGLFRLSHGTPTFAMQGPQLLSSGSQAARGKSTGISNCLIIVAF
jgi:hypothetical protein